jgi:transcriptional regulator with XRE-family HTH domain
MTLVAEETQVEDEMGEEARLAYAQAVGARLRAVRQQKSLSLQALETATSSEFKASVMGAYERGERAISVPRLQRLARFYDVPVDQLLPEDSTVGGRWGGGTRTLVAPAQRKVVIDLVRLMSISGPERDLLRRYLSMIQAHRGDFNGKMITIRDEDVRAISCLFGISPEMMERRLSDLEVLVTS